MCQLISCSVLPLSSSLFTGSSSLWPSSPLFQFVSWWFSQRLNDNCLLLCRGRDFLFHPPSFCRWPLLSLSRSLAFLTFPVSLYILLSSELSSASVSMLVFDSPSVSIPLADERAECFLLLLSRWRWKSDLFVDAVTVVTSHLFARLQPLTSNS